LQQGTCRREGQPEVLKESESSAWVDGHNLLGPVVGKFCIDLAIRKAKRTGIACVACKGSNHFGIGGYYAHLAAKQQMIVIKFEFVKIAATKRDRVN
jgi:LDH2 family malate/lactate/ureidoglycolate dehydrogenase